jgi:mannosyltransferase
LLAAISGRRAVPAALLAILGLAAALRFVELGHDSIWVDEAFSARVSDLSLTDLVRTATADDTNPPIYYVLLHFWMDAFGDSAAALRSLSAVVGVLLVFMVFKLGERLSGSRAGLIGAVLAAVSEFLVHYSQEARVYSLLALLSACSYYFLIVLLDGLRRWPVAGYVVTTTALLYAHTYGLFVFAAQVAFFSLALFWHRDWIRMRDPERLGLVFAAPLVLAIPWLVVFAGHVSDEVEGSSDAKLSWLAEPSLRELPGTLSGYAGSRWALVLALVALALAAGRALRDTGTHALIRRLAADRRVGVLVLWAVVPIAVPFVLSILVTPIYQFKYTIPAAIACYLLLALALESLEPRIALAAGALVAGAFLVMTVRYYEDYETEQWRQATAYISAHAKPGDVLVFDSSVGKEAFDYYWGRSDVQEVIGSAETSPTEGDLQAVRTAAREPGSVWLVVSHSRDVGGRIAAILDQTRTPGEEAGFLGIRLIPFT